MVIENSIFSGHNTCGVIPGGLGSTKQAWEPMSCYIDHCVFHNIDKTGSVSGVSCAPGYAICTVNYPGTLSVTNTTFHTIAHSAIRDWNIEDPNFSENWVVRSDYNCFYHVEDDPLRLLPTGSNSLVDQNPLMIDPDNADVSLQAGSPCLGEASDGTNIGAWQSSTSVSDFDYSRDFNNELGVMQNPFQGSVSFNFDSYGGARLSIYSAQGRLVNSMVVRDGMVKWDGTDFSGNELAPGLYYYGLNADNLNELRSVIKMD